MIYLLLCVVVLPANQEMGDSAKLEVGGAVESRASDEGLKGASQEGLWPSPKLQALLLRRFAADIGAQYDFDEAQQTELEQAVLDRWTPFLELQREQLKPLVNEFLELKMQLEPPPKAEIQSWAKRALPQFELITAQLYEGVDDLRDVATELQRVKIDAQALLLGGALTYGETQLTFWREGEFDPADFTAPTRTQRRQRRAKRKAKNNSGASKPDADANADADADHDAEPAKEAPRDFIEEELSLWDQYVADFVRRFELDEGQRSSAKSVLAEMKQRALGHRSQRVQELAALETQLARENQTPAEQAEIKGKIQDLYGPVDALFAELKRRVDQLPTASQWARAADREKAAGTEEAKQEAVPTQPAATKKEKESPASPSPMPTKDRESDKGR